MPLSEPASLDARLLAAHEAGARPALISLYLEAAEATTDPDATGFYLTHAYVFALEDGSAQAADIKAKLVALERER